MGVDGPSWPATWIYDAPFWSQEVLRPENPRRDPYNQPFVDRESPSGPLNAVSPTDSMWKDAIRDSQWKDSVRMQRMRAFEAVAHGPEEIAVIDGLGIAGVEVGNWGDLGAISTACRNHITVFNTAWGLCSLPPASIIPGTGVCREIAKGGLRASASSIGGECPGAANSAVMAAMGIVPTPAPAPMPGPSPDKMSETTKTVLLVGGGAVGVGLLIWLLK